MEEELNRMDPEWNSVKVTSQFLTVPLTAEGEAVGQNSVKGIEFLDVYVEATYTSGGALRIETSLFRKPAAADLQMLASSYHSWEVKAGMVKGEAIRYLIICSTEDRFERAWSRYEIAMCNRGYTKEWLKEKRQVRWEDRAKYLNGEGMRKRDRGTGSVPLVIERRPGMEEWWRRIRNQGMDTGWTGEWIEDRLMPTRVYKVEKSTASLKGFMKGVER